MTLTTHTATAILVTQWTNNIWLGFFVGLVSHYLTDAIPHGDEWLYWRHVHNRKDPAAMIVAAVDILLLCVILYLMIEFRDGIDIAMLGFVTIGAIGPDLLITAHTNARDRFKERYGKAAFFQKWYHWFLKKHYVFHMFCHNMMHTPIRYRSAVAYQSVFLFFFVYFFVLP